MVSKIVKLKLTKLHAEAGKMEEKTKIQSCFPAKIKEKIKKASQIYR